MKSLFRFSAAAEYSACLIAMVALQTSELSAEASLNTIEKVDGRVRDYAQSHHSDAGDKLFKIARVFGEWKLYAAANALVYADDKRRGELMLKGGLITGIATESTRNIVDRVRPRKATGPTHYHPKKGNAFPSGHTSSAFALATSLDENYGIGYATYPVATLTAMSRMYHDGHWLSDTMMGAAIGIASVKAVALHDEEGVEPSRSSDVFGIAAGTYTVADLVAFNIKKGPARTALRLGAIGIAASQIDEESDVYAAFAGIAASVLFTRSLKKLKGLRIGPSSVSFAWKW